MSVVNINISNIDRLLRVILGLVLALAPFMVSLIAIPSLMGFAALFAGCILTITATVGFCPIYSVIGWGSRS